MSEALNAELSKRGVHVSAICPGVIDTPIVASSVMRGDFAAMQENATRYYARRGASPDEVAEAVTAHDRASPADRHRAAAPRDADVPAAPPLPRARTAAHAELRARRRPRLAVGARARRRRACGTRLGWRAGAGTSGGRARGGGDATADEPRRAVPGDRGRTPLRPRERARDLRSAERAGRRAQRRAACARRSPSACTCCRRSAGASRRSRSGSTTPTGSTTSASTSSSTCARWRSPRPASDAQLAEQVARIFARQLDRSRPLWELYVIEGLERRARGGAHEDPPRRRRRAVRRGDPERAARRLARGPLHRTAARGRRAAASARRASVEMLGRGLAGLPRQPVRVVRRLPKTLANLDVLPTMRHLPGATQISSLTRQRGSRGLAAPRRRRRARGPQPQRPANALPGDRSPPTGACRSARSGCRR